MQSVTSKIAVNAVQLEARSVASHGLPLLEDCDRGKTLLDQLVRRANAGRTSSENDYMGQGSLRQRRLIGSRLLRTHKSRLLHGRLLAVVLKSGKMTK